MKVRRQGGATLGLTAACVLLVIVIGVGFYFLSKIIGGGREVANATDAGALNVAKQALKRGTAPLTGAAAAEFGSLTDPPNSGTVTLITYNRIIAQAMMVAQNAVVENTPLAKANAVTTATLAQSVGNALRTSLNGAATGSLQGDFNSIAGVSNTKMWNGNPVSVTAISTGFLKANGSTNVIFDANTIAALNNWSPNMTTNSGSPSYGNQPNSTDFLGSAVASGHYMPGYDSNTFLGGAVKLTGVPVFPNTKPHLVDIGTFNSDLATNALFASDINTPCNSFHADAQAVESKSGNMAGSLACAVVGVLNKDFKASFPRGFVRISNGPDAVANNGGFGVPISDGTTDIFNNQLFTGPGASPGASGITQDNSTGVFTTNPTDLDAWSNFNNRVGMYDNSSSTPQNIATMTTAGLVGPAWVAYNVNPAGTVYLPGQYVPGPGPGASDLPTMADPNIVGPAPESINDMGQNPANYDANEGGLRSGASCATPYATLSQLENIGGSRFNCNYTMYDPAGLAANPQCGSMTNVDNWQQNYQCTLTLPSGGGIATSGPNQGVTNVEYLKAELLVKIAGRLGGSFCADVDIPSAAPSGVKYFNRGVPGTTTGGGGSAVAFDPGSGGSSPVVNFETVGTPYQYLTQITDPSTLGGAMGSCGQGSASAIVDQITARMQQIESGVTTGQVVTALKSQQLHLKGGSFSSDNGTLYMYVDPASHTPMMAATLPGGWTDTTVGSPNFPDGPAPAVGSGECYDQYPLNGWVVDTQYTMTGTGKGDAHYHDQPFTQPGMAPGGVGENGASGGNGPGGPMAISPNQGGAPGPNMYGQDQAIFKPSSGSQNNLGELKFQENTQGTTFCKPN